MIVAFNIETIIDIINTNTALPSLQLHIHSQTAPCISIIIIIYNTYQIVLIVLL